MKTKLRQFFCWFAGIALIIALSFDLKAQSKNEVAELAKDLGLLHQKAMASRADLKDATLKYRASLDGLMNALRDQEARIQEAVQKKQASVQQGTLKEESLQREKDELLRLQKQMTDTEQRTAKADEFLREVENLPEQKIDFMAQARKIIAERKTAERKHVARRQRTVVVVIVGMFVIEDYGPRKGRVYKSRSGQILATSQR